MVITKEFLKAEIDNVQDEYLDALYRIIKVFEYPPETKAYNRIDVVTRSTQQPAPEWLAYVNETYGCLADDPIERGEQGTYEICVRA